MRTTEFEDLEDEATNVRMREDSESTMMFDFSRMRSKNNNSNVSVGQVKIDVHRSANFPKTTIRPSSSESSGNDSNKITSSAKKALGNIFGSAKKIRPHIIAADR